MQDLLGNIVGVGSNRVVYENLNDSNSVIKVQRPKTLKKNNTLSNVIEWNIWNRYKNTELEKIFCPCIDISDDGVYLLQTRVEILEPGKHLKRSRKIWNKLPQDIKNLPDSRWYKNWGRLLGNYVIVDYGRAKDNLSKK